VKKLVTADRELRLTLHTIGRSKKKEDKKRRKKEKKKKKKEDFTQAYVLY
jgi:hypothetical protein